jgi:lactaldehyde dehydrogenase / glycolaldehyde dehydrogenase
MTIQTMRDFGIGEGQLYIGGRWVDSASRDRREIES